MFFAALTSALSVYAQAMQRKRAWLWRLSGARCPHAGQRWLVNAGLTPARSRVTRNDFAFPGTARVQRNRTHPALRMLTLPGLKVGAPSGDPDDRGCFPGPIRDGTRSARRRGPAARKRGAYPGGVAGALGT